MSRLSKVEAAQSLITFDTHLEIAVTPQFKKMI